MKYHNVNIPVLPGKLVIIYVESLEELRIPYELDPNDDVSTMDGVSFRALNGDYIAAFEKYAPSIIVHECVHLVNLLFEQKHIQLDIRNDEHQAYWTQWFFETIDKYMQQYDKNKENHRLIEIKQPEELSD